jgi:transcriptional regulator with XRE-family HTH domain
MKSALGAKMIRLRVKEIAEQKGLSQARVSRMSDVDITTVRKIYRHPSEANVTLETLTRLAKALGVSIHDIIEELPDEPPEKP